VVRQTEIHVTVHYRIRILSIVVLFIVAVGSVVRAQQPCSVTPVLRIRMATNIFNAQQERTLGDIEAEWVESNYHPVHDVELAVHLNTVAARILSQFPPDRARVRIILIDTSEAESFSVGPERIYITRKMIASLKNDDELAGLLGHELGHILAHQNAVIVSQLFRRILGVNTISDRKDILETMTRLFATIDRDRKLSWKSTQIIETQEAIHQYEADRVALYASAAAGFSPQAFVDLFNRSAKTNGKVGNFMTDIFAATNSDTRRLREIKKILKGLPGPCREIAPASSTEFRSWQAAVNSYPDFGTHDD
jgi:predicted Zn-dependent protease